MKNFLIAGRHPVLEALKAGQKIDKLLFQKGSRGEGIDEIRRIVKERKIVYQVIPEARMHRIYKKNHQGVIAFLPLIDYVELNDVIQWAYEKGEDPFLVILDGITDVRNLGAIARSALGLGAHALLIPSKGGAPINPDAMKTSAGALNHLPVCKIDNWWNCIKDLKESGIYLAVLDSGGKAYIKDIPKNTPLAIVLGSEDKGPSKTFISEADDHFRIPMEEILESYNVSVAAAITLYEIKR